MRGLVVSETAQNVVLKTADDAEPVTVQKAQIATRTNGRRRRSCRSDLIDKVGGDINIAHVVAYLMAGK